MINKHSSGELTFLNEFTRHFSGMYKGFEGQDLLMARFLTTTATRSTDPLHFSIYKLCKYDHAIWIQTVIPLIKRLDPTFGRERHDK